MPAEDLDINDPSHPTKKRALKWKRKSRVLMLCSRRVDYRSRHLMKNLIKFLPHSKTDSKFDRKKGLNELNETAEIKNCSKIMYFESHKLKDVFLYMSDIKLGYSAVFLLHNVCTMEELKLTGNCLKTSRAVLSFGTEFDGKPHLNLFKEMFVSVFSTPVGHPKSQPFIDHVFTFSLVDDKIWFRNYQILPENSGLAEVGPRMVLEPVKIFNGSFSGSVIYKNPLYRTPNTLRRFEKLQKQRKSHNRLVEQLATRTKKKKKAALLNFDADADFIFEDE
ncbi:ribosome biogenesis protein BRX1 homolog [Convolutriloba macropyga]|uniref:ribosome biogenesis protein BRX1 homolog n=1 Tax=Convolutriloba macropyga TaxID=536237 RepID=UPI003F52372A